MLKLLSFLSVTVVGSYAMACNQPTLRTPVEIAESLRGKVLNCNYNGVESVGSISVSYPRCPNGNPIVRFTAFDENLSVNELTLAGETLTVVSDELDIPVTCSVE